MDLDFASTPYDRIAVFITPPPSPDSLQCRVVAPATQIAPPAGRLQRRLLLPLYVPLRGSWRRRPTWRLGTGAP